ncbi:MAG: hypothetical protein VW405_06250 [Rhodospirillaceae bacterium]
MYGEAMQQTDAAPTNLAASPDLQRRLVQQWKESRPWHYEVATRRDLAHRFYAGDQWDASARAKLRAEGRPATVINQVFKAINNVSGKQRDSRLRWKAFPIAEDDILTAEAVTRGAEYLEGACNWKYTESRIFKDAALCWGWVEVGYDETDPNKEPVFADYVPDEEMTVDPWGRALDLSDYRYLIRAKEVDLDLALAMFPGKEAILRAASADRKVGERERIAGDYGNRDDGTSAMGYLGSLDETHGRERVSLREHHYWETEDTRYILLPNGETVDFDAEDPMAFAALRAGGQMMAGKQRCFYVAIMAGERLLEVRKSDLPFRRFPYACLWSFQDHEGRPSGLVDQMIWPQREMNVNRSRANESMRSRWLIYSKGALGGGMTADMVGERLSHSNFVLEVNDPNGIQMGSDKADLSGWMQMMETSRREVDEVAGQNEAAYGDKSNEKSGKAIATRVAQQSLNLGELWDNWRFFRLQVGRMMLALAIKKWPREKWQRIVSQTVISENEQAMRLAVMTGQAPPTRADLSWVGRAVLGINSLFRYDLRLEDQAETTTEREAVMSQAIELVGYLPDPAKMAVVPDVIRMSDFPDKDTMASKAEAAMAPPAPPGPPGPMPMDGPPMEPPMPAPGLLPPELAG